MEGRRLPDGEISGEACFEAGVYGRIAHDGAWHGCAPNGMLCNFAIHQVEEHQDGTITVSPSILVSQDDLGSWHGYLEHGIWRSV